MSWWGDYNGQTQDNEYDVWHHMLPADVTGQTGFNDFRVTNWGCPNPQIDAVYPDMVWNSALNEYFVVFQGTEGGTVIGSTEIYGIRLNASGTIISGRFPISNCGAFGDPSRQANVPSVDYNRATDQYYVDWHCDNNVDEVFDVYGQMLSSGGTPLGSAQRLSFRSMANINYDALAAKVAADHSSGGFAITYYGDNAASNEYEVWASTVDLAGAVLATDVRVSQVGIDGDATILAQYPDMAWNARDNEFLVAWQQFGPTIGW